MPSILPSAEAVASIREIEIGIPSKNGRLEVLYVHTRGMPLDESLDLKEIADSTHGFVGADLYCSMQRGSHANSGEGAA